MSIISKPTVTPNRVGILVAYLGSHGEEGMLPAELDDILSPAAVGSHGLEEAPTDSDSATVRELREEARALGLLEDADGGRIRVPEGLRQLAGPSLREYLDLALTSPDRADQHGQLAFTRALCWFLAQDPASPPGWRDTSRLIVGQQLVPERQSLVDMNDLGYQNFVYWSRYLGYAWRMRVSLSTSHLEPVVPDPTSVLQGHIQAVLREQRELPIGDLMAAISVRTVVFESGSVREEIDEAFIPTLRRPGYQLSRSTSIALSRLERRGILRIERRADSAHAVSLSLWPDTTPITHIALRRGAA